MNRVILKNETYGLIKIEITADIIVEFNLDLISFIVRLNEPFFICCLFSLSVKIIPFSRFFPNLFLLNDSKQKVDGKLG